VAHVKGYFKEVGLDVDITLTRSLGELSKDYVAGKMQGRANLTLEAVNEHLQGLDHKIVLAIDYSNGADAIVARKDVLTVKDFQGKRVGYEPNTLEEFFVVWALNENGLNLSDVVPVYGNPEETVRLLTEGKLDVAVSHEPFLSRFISESSDFHTVFTSADAPGLITDVLTFRTDFIEAHPETIQAILLAYFKGLRVWKEHPEEAAAIMGQKFGDPAESITQQLKQITMLDERDNKTVFTFSSGLQSLYGNMRQIGKFVSKHREGASSQLDTDSLIENRFIQQILEVKQ
jgi:NitT/TauT family transport system substrate-binding protein